ncbi:MAG TPA: HD domain-containing protein [Phycisphaerales bacterium]|nr:HD domain-containing protein [Phycisphaerales bacterium]
MGQVNRDAWQAAAAFAARAHRHQVRNDGRTPYIAHPMRVAITVRHVFGCEDEGAMCAALLHDTIEDTTTDYDDVAGGFGEEVAGIVGALTKNMAMPLAEREADYDARLARADWRARLVKLADVFDNWCDCAELSAEARAKLPGRAERALALAEPDRAGHPEMERAVRAVRGIVGM